MKTFLLVVVIVAALAGECFAQQGYTIYGPRRQPTYVTPNAGGGYSVYGAGRQPSYVAPNPNGGYEVYTPGRQPVYIVPNQPKPYRYGW